MWLLLKDPARDWGEEVTEEKWRTEILQLAQGVPLR